MTKKKVPQRVLEVDQDCKKKLVTVEKALREMGDVDRHERARPCIKEIK